MTSAGFKKIVFSLLLSLLTFNLKAQFIKASIGINGLTCSQCSRSVEMQLRKLSFVKEVQMDLELTKGTIIFNDKQKVNIAAIAQAVKDAGFSVRFLKAELQKEPALISEQGCFTLNGDTYTILGALPPAGNPHYRLQFVGKNYLPAGEWKKYKLPQFSPCKGKTSYFAIAN